MHNHDIFFDPDSVHETPPEVRLFDKMTNPCEYDEALRLYKALVAEGVPSEKAVIFAAQEVVPLTWSDSSADQSSEQLSS